jgi:hypothetical protein
LHIIKTLKIEIPKTAGIMAPNSGTTDVPTIDILSTQDGN